MQSQEQVEKPDTAQTATSPKQADRAERKSEPQPPPPLRPKASLGSTASTLPPYTERALPPPSYSSSALRAAQRNGAVDCGSRKAPSSAPRASGPNAAAVRAMLSTSSASTDKMHTHHQQRVEDWNEDPTYRQKVASKGGLSSSKWNYFGAEIGQYGNPFKSLSRKK